mmetsp:Transcript_123844/g.396438  ORF Transcript_123844/g.396438 Transcript_123844/m.396438 type:complete len:902 (-) Transcript_123844:47-2752(-)
MGRAPPEPVPTARRRDGMFPACSDGALSDASASLMQLLAVLRGEDSADDGEGLGGGPPARRPFAPSSCCSSDAGGASLPGAAAEFEREELPPQRSCPSPSAAAALGVRPLAFPPRHTIAHGAADWCESTISFSCPSSQKGSRRGADEEVEEDDDDGGEAQEEPEDEAAEPSREPFAPAQGSSSRAALGGRAWRRAAEEAEEEWREEEDEDLRRGCGEEAGWRHQSASSSSRPSQLLEQQRRGSAGVGNPSQGSDQFLHALELFLAFCSADSSGDGGVGDRALMEHVQDLAAKFHSLSQFVPPSGLSRMPDLLQTLSETRGLLRQREGELLHGDAELARTVSILQKRELELEDTHTQLQEARKAIRDKDARLATYEGDLAATRQLLQKTRVELEARVQEVQKICLQMPSTGITGAAREVVPCTGATAQKDELTSCKEQLRHSQEEASRACRELRQVRTHAEQELEDYSNFVRQLADTSGGPVLDRMMHLDTASIIGAGHYGWVLLCEERGGRGRTVVKLQSNRWIDVAAREWAHASSMGSHPHVLGCRQVFLHKDSDRSIERKLEAGFASGELSGRRPRRFPDCYVCITIDYMDRGTVQELIDRRLCDVEGVAAIVRMTASGLAYMHKQQRTHNDVKPANVLLQASPRGDGTLTVRLADFGLAEHSAARRRDCELLAHTAWCTGLCRTFKRAPEVSQRAPALKEFRATARAGRGGAGSGNLAADEERWHAIADVIEGLWQGDLTAAEVADSEGLQECEVRISASGDAHLEVAAKETTMRIVEVAATAQSKWRHVRNTLRPIVGMARRVSSTASPSPVPSCSPEPSCSPASTPRQAWPSPGALGKMPVLMQHRSVASPVEQEPAEEPDRPEPELELSGSLSPFAARGAAPRGRGASSLVDSPG